MTFKDQLNRIISLSKPPERIVSLVPSQTELLVDLGLEKRIAGITKFCVHPSRLKKMKTIVGGTKQVHYDKIKTLAPDLIICNKEENSEAMVRHLDTIAPVWVSDVVSFKDAGEMITNIGAICDVSEKALKLRDAIEVERQFFSEYIKEKAVKKVLYLIWKDPYMAAGKGTFIDTLLEFNRLENIISDSGSRYPAVEEAHFQKADIIMLSSEPYPFKLKHRDALKKKYGKQIYQVDGEFFSWYGSRLLKAFTYFKTIR